jgi:hypothetical protein
MAVPSATSTLTGAKLTFLIHLGIDLGPEARGPRELILDQEEGIPSAGIALVLGFADGASFEVRLESGNIGGRKIIPYV